MTAQDKMFPLKLLPTSKTVNVKLVLVFVLLDDTNKKLQSKEKV